MLAGAYVARQHCDISASGRAPASTDRHFYWLKSTGGCSTRQQRYVLAVRTNFLWPSDKNTNQTLGSGICKKKTQVDI